MATITNFVFGFGKKIDLELTEDDKVFLGSIVGFNEAESLIHGIGFSVCEDSSSVSFATFNFDGCTDLDGMIAKVFNHLDFLSGVKPSTLYVSHGESSHQYDFTVYGEAVNCESSWHCIYGELDSQYSKPEVYQVEGLVSSERINS